jgi:hypothetical protein
LVHTIEEIIGVELERTDQPEYRDLTDDDAPGLARRQFEGDTRIIS